MTSVNLSKARPDLSRDVIALSENADAALTQAGLDPLLVNS